MNSSSASLIIRCLGENSDESLVRIYSKMETNYITVNRIISMCDPLVELLFLFKKVALMEQTKRPHLKDKVFLFTRLRGFEPLTVRLEGVCSILLS